MAFPPNLHLPGSANTCGCLTKRRTVTDYALRPCWQSAGPLPASAGDRVIAGDGAGIQIATDIKDGCVAQLWYDASSCVTLIAYAEVLAELAIGAPVAEVIRLTPDVLTERLPGVPVFRQQRALLVIHAMWSALACALNSAPEGHIE